MNDSVVQRALERVRRLLERMHCDQGGAVMLMCLASFIILFLLALTLYDAGTVARNKVDVQSAADVHAYSQSAAKARAMNMIAYGNIAKRTLVGIHNTYWAMWEGYLIWIAQQCSKCCKWPWCWIACANCAVNGFLALWEGLTDWFWFSGFGSSIMPNLSSLFSFQAQVSQLNAYQTYTVFTAPWWAWAEGVLRAARNGATISGSYPPLPSLATGVVDWLDFVIGIFGGSTSGGTSFIYDWLPVANWHKILTVTPQAWPVWGGLGVYVPAEGCLAPTLGINTVTGGSLTEWGLDVAEHRRRSWKGWGPIKGPGSGGPMARGIGLQLAGFCLWRNNSFSTPIMWMNMAPFHNIAPSNSPHHMAARQNVVFAYKHTPHVQSVLRNNFNIVSHEYAVSGDLSALEGSSGMWALSSSEIFFPESNLPSINALGFGGGWMWHTGWTGKMRPVALPGQYETLGYSTQEMLADISPFMTVARTLIGVMGAGYDSNAGDEDMHYLHKATVGMDEPSMNGIAK